MSTKKTTALLGCALLLAAAVPLALAHQTSPSAVSDALTPLSESSDQWRRGSSGTTGVSGNYVGGVGALLISDVLFPELEDNALSFAFALCDLEVLGDGSGHDALDEGTVDSDDDNGASDPMTDLGALLGPGQIPDGTWDDGGAGGACHTNDQYSHADYNTDGCEGTAYAEDAVSGKNVWIGAACDWATHGDGPGLSGCVINEVISEPTVGGLQQCVADFLAGGATGAFVDCGDDASADDVRYGRGGGQDDPGVDFPGLDNGCTGDHAAAAVFVFQYGGNPVGNPGGFNVAPATAGWIDSSLVGGGGGVDVSPLPECSDGVDNDNDGFVDRHGGINNDGNPASPDPDCAGPLDNSE